MSYLKNLLGLLLIVSSIGVALSANPNGPIVWICAGLIASVLFLL
jgi:hypothetical protein